MGYNFNHCNTTLEDSYIDEDPLWQTVTFHDFALVLSMASVAISSLISLALMVLHAQHYSEPWEQRQYVATLVAVVP